MAALLPRPGWAIYDHLGGLVLVNLLWSGLSLPWFALGGLVLTLSWGGSGPLAAAVHVAGAIVALEIVLIAPPGVVFFVAGARWAKGESVNWQALWTEFTSCFLRAQLLGLLCVGLSVILWINLFFYQQLGGWLGLVLGGVMIWMLLALFLVVPYGLPLLVTQKGSLWQTVRQSAFMALDNVTFSLVQTLGSAVALGLCLASGIGLFCGGAAALGLWTSVRLRRLFVKYTGEELAVEPPRAWGDLVRPWE